MAEPISINGNEVYADVVERRGGLRLGLDVDEWRGLRLRQGQRVPIRRGELPDLWLHVAEVTEVRPTCWVELRAKYDGPVEEPPARPRRERRAVGAGVAAEPRYEGHIIHFPEPAAEAAPILPFPGVEESPPPPAVLAIDQGGAHAELLRAGEKWLRTYKPHSRYGVFVSDEGDDDTPMTQVTIRPNGVA